MGAPKRHTDETIAEIVRLMDQGYGQVTVGTMLGLSHNSVHSIYSRHRPQGKPLPRQELMDKFIRGRL